MALGKGKIVTLFGVKGGIGKSIMATNIAGVASNKGLKTLLIDMDIFSGSIGFSLNKIENNTIYNFVDDYNNNRFKDINNYITKYNDNIDYIVSPKDPRQSNKIIPSYLEILIDKVKFNYDLVVIDTNHILNEINLSILDKSDDILLILSNDIFDIKNMKNLISIFKDLDKTNYKMLLNNSIHNNDGYFNNYDIKNIIKNNIDYIISNRFYIRNIDDFIMDGKIVTLLKKYQNTNDYKVMERIIDDIVGDNNE